MEGSTDKESRTEEATEKKIRDSTEKGNVPVSREASIFASLAGIFIVAVFFLKDGSMRLAGSLERLLDDPGGWRLEGSADAVSLFTAIGGDAARMLVPIVVILAVAGIVAAMLQNAPRLVLDRIKPQLSRISLRDGWSRIFSSRGGTEFLKSLAKFIGIAIVALVLLGAERDRVMSAMLVEPSAVPEMVLAASMRLLSAVSVATILLVAADLVWARLHWRRDLRMSRQEVKDEYKQVEGDPVVKARLRSLARDRSRRRMISAVPRATLVIANPTHFAVALRYLREEGGAPLVVAKGTDLVALKIREIAEKHEIPVVEDKALARSLHKSVEVDQMIPSEFYRAVAEVIHFIHIRRPAAAAAAIVR